MSFLRRGGRPVQREGGRPVQREYERRAALPAPDLDGSWPNGSSDTQRSAMRTGSNSLRLGCARLIDHPGWPGVAVSPPQ